MNKDGSGQELKIVSIYQIKQLDFVEIFNDNCLMLGFRANQTVNLKNETDKNGKTNSTILVDNNGDTLKSYTVQKQIVKIIQDRKTPEWM